MSFVFEKHHVEKFDVTTVGFNFLKYNVFDKSRNDKPNCEFCGYKFKTDDWTHLAMVKGKVNHLICDNCANKAVSGGAKKVNIKHSN